jgi:hypothetical protein
MADYKGPLFDSGRMMRSLSGRLEGLSHEQERLILDVMEKMKAIEEVNALQKKVEEAELAEGLEYVKKSLGYEGEL